MSNIRKVSEVAGVSIATVSRTLKNPDLVTKETREKVLKAIEETGYRPNRMASNFSSGKSFLIVVLVNDLTNPFFSRIIKGVEEVAQENGYSVLLGDTHGIREREHKYAHLLLTHQADGLIQLDHSFPFNEEDARLAGKMPIVSVCDEIDSDFKYPHVTIDNYKAGREVGKHLLELGHKSFATISGPDDSQITTDRLDGLKSILAEHGIRVAAKWQKRGEYTMQSGERCAQELFSGNERPSAVFCFNDEIALGAYKAIKQAGLRIPQDVSVVGFDNIDTCAYMDPPLTTMDQPAQQMGRRAMELLYKLMNNEPLDELVEYNDFNLVVRESTQSV